MELEANKATPRQINKPRHTAWLRTRTSWRALDGRSVWRAWGWMLGKARHGTANDRHAGCMARCFGGGSRTTRTTTTTATTYHYHHENELDAARGQGHKATRRVGGWQRASVRGREKRPARGRCYWAGIPVKLSAGEQGTNRKAQRSAQRPIRSSRLSSLQRPITAPSRASHASPPIITAIAFGITSLRNDDARGLHQTGISLNTDASSRRACRLPTPPSRAFRTRC